MDRAGQPGSHKASPDFSSKRRFEKQGKPFAKFGRTVDRELEKAILDLMKSFRDEMTRLRKRT